MVEEKISSINGVHYVDYDVENETLVFHFEKDKSRIQAESWLIENGHVQSPDTSFHVLPSCCPKPDTSSVKNGK
jgi:hypothetical protein